MGDIISGIFGDNDAQEQAEQEQQRMQAELEKEQAEEKQKQDALMQQQIQAIKRKQGGDGGGSMFDVANAMNVGNKIGS